MRIIRAGAPASVAACAFLLATTATVGLAITATTGEAMTAFALAVACAHACANRKAADAAVAGLGAVQQVAWNLVTECMNVTTAKVLLERQVDALKAELSGSFQRVPEVANDGR